MADTESKRELIDDGGKQAGQHLDLGQVEEVLGNVDGDLVKESRGDVEAILDVVQAAGCGGQVLLAGQHGVVCAADTDTSSLVQGIDGTAAAGNVLLQQTRQNPQSLPPDQRHDSDSTAMVRTLAAWPCLLLPQSGTKPEASISSNVLLGDWRSFSLGCGRRLPHIYQKQMLSMPPIGQSWIRECSKHLRFTSATCYGCAIDVHVGSI